MRSLVGSNGKANKSALKQLQLPSFPLEKEEQVGDMAVGEKVEENVNALRKSEPS